MLYRFDIPTMMSGRTIKIYIVDLSGIISCTYMIIYYKSQIKRAMQSDPSNHKLRDR